MPQLFLCRKNRVVQETWNGTGKSAVSSLVRMSTDTQLPFAVYLTRIRAHGWDPLVPTATGIYDGPQGAPRLSPLVASHQGSVDGKDRPVVQQDFDLFWKDTPLYSVK
jgi:hypothetical protein